MKIKAALKRMREREKERPIGKSTGTTVGVGVGWQLTRMEKLQAEAPPRPRPGSPGRLRLATKAELAKNRKCLGLLRYVIGNSSFTPAHHPYKRTLPDQIQGSAGPQPFPNSTGTKTIILPSHCRLPSGSQREVTLQSGCSS